LTANNEEKKVALFAFNGDFKCFAHVLLNALDMKARGYLVKVVIEGSATKLVPEMAAEGGSMHPLFMKAKEAGLIDGVCLACSREARVLDAIEEAVLPLLDEMSGHPSMARYLDDGYRVLIF
jgi:predicted peroxiredoxin